MKKIVILAIISAFCFGSACTSTTRVYTVQTTNSNSGKVPPGQMKKATGAKSAKQYAPGQQKKKNR